MYNESFSESLKRGYRAMPVAIRTIITLNVAVFVLQIVVGAISSSSGTALLQSFAFFPEWHTALFQPWRAFTYMFLHGGFLHILFNMLWLWWMGRSVEQQLGPRTFTVIYLVSGLGGALLDVIVAPLLGYNPVIGASGAVFGIMVSFAMLYPRMPIRLILLPPIEARYVVAGLIAINFLTLGTGNTAHSVHLAGAGVGYLMVKAQLEGSKDFSKWWLPVEKLWYFLKNKYQQLTAQSGPKNSDMYSVSDVEVIDEEEQSELDEILEKISQKGYDGLSDAEKKKLFELSKDN